MIACLDASAINRLLDDSDSQQLTATLLSRYDVRVTALNVIEIGKTPEPDRREKLRALEKRLAGAFEPLDMPNELIKKLTVAFFAVSCVTKTSQNGRDAALQASIKPALFGGP